MGSQFKKPFSVSDKASPKEAPPSVLAEQRTQQAPAAHMPPPSQGYVQGQHGTYGSGPAKKLFRRPGQLDDSPATPPSGPLQDGSAPGVTLASEPTMRMPMGGPQGKMPGNAPPFVGPQGGAPPALPPVGRPMGRPQGNTLFAGMQAPIAPMGGPGTALGPQGMGGMPMPSAPNWMGPRPSTRDLAEKPASVRDRERAGAGKGKKGKKKRRVPIWARVVIGMLLFCIALTGTGFIYYQVNFASSVSSITGKQFVRVKGETDPNQGKTGSVLNWGRINVLLLGSDTDEKPVWGGNSYLAQTVIVASIDTNTHDVDMLSIPRDYYIPIPGYGMDKLDTAFAHGGSVNNNMSGVSTVVATLDQDFGIKINFYAWVGLQGFIKVINTVNGVDVNVMHPVVDDSYPDDITSSGKSKAGYGYERVYVPDGPQHLDGVTALEYVRSRHSTTDFDRSARQQQVLSALRLKLDNANVIGQLPQIAQDLQGYLYTSLTTTQLLDLGNFARGIDADKIKHLTLGGTIYSTSGQVKQNGVVQDVVYPNCSTVPEAINSFLHITTAVCNVSAASAPSSSVLASLPVASNTGGSASATFPLTSVVDLAHSNLALGGASLATSDLFGVRDLLDLMSMVVLDSPQV